MNRRMNLSMLMALCVFVAALAGPAAGRTIYVDPNGSADFNSIQAAINDANDGNEIEVAPGTYYEAINFNGKAVRLYSRDGRDVTTIDANGAYHAVQCVMGEGPNTVLDGFTITGGNANGSDSNSWGGGMYCDNSSPTVTNCSFSLNSAQNGGGGMCNSNNSSPTVTNCAFSGNWSNNGGGVFNHSSSPTVTNCTFSGNSGGNGGGMANYNSSPTVTNCTFTGNTSVSGGGGMRNISGSSPTVTNCTFTGNEATNANGGGMYNHGSSPTVTNCILWGDTPDEIYDFASSSTVSYSDVQGGWGGAGGNNINADPCFVDADSNDFHLSPDSPCIDAGDNNSVPADTADLDGDGNTAEPIPFDLDGNPRILGNVVDMGAYEDENPEHTLMILSTANGSVTQPGEGNFQYPHGTVVPIVAQADPCCAFLEWTGTAVLAGKVADPCAASTTVTVDADYTLVANFDTHMLTVSSTSGGTVTSPGEGVLLYPSETVVAIVAEADPCYGFVEWTGTAVDANKVVDPCQASTTVTVDADYTLTAKFARYIFYVDANASGNNDGSSWADAYNYLQDALGAAGCDSNILVAQGIYYPDANSANPGGTSKREATFQLINAVAIYGGFPPDGGDWESRDPNAYETILSGDINVPGDANDNSYHVVQCVSGEDANTILEGFTITGGNANGDLHPHWHGGGMLNDGNSSPTVTNCTFSGNTATFDGGGIFNWDNSSPTVTDCTFSSNSAQRYGGGMASYSSSPTVTNCTFSGNSAVDYGGGMYNYQNSPTVTDCNFTGNSAGWNGGGMDNEDNSSPTVTNCTFSGNSAVGNDGGAINNRSSSPTITNCNFSDNSAYDWGGAVRNVWSSSPTLTNCIFVGNSSDEGAGMFNWDNSSPTVTNCTFSGNIADANGGGMCNYGNSSPTVTNCTFSGNSAGWDGGGMCNAISSPTVTNCTFISNYCTGIGGGMENYNYSSPTVTNCTFTGNSAAWDGGGMDNYNSNPTVTNCTFSGNVAGMGMGMGGGMCNYDSSPTVTNCIFWGDEPDEVYDDFASFTTVSYSDVEGDWWGAGGNNIDADPGFVDADANDSRLLYYSPCIDAGDNGSVPADTADLDGDGNTVEPIPFDLGGLPRFVDDLCTGDTGNGAPPVVDMGAYEYLPADIDGSGAVDLRDFCEFALHWADTGCGRCGGANMDCDADVDWSDLAELVDWWLAGP